MKRTPYKVRYLTLSQFDHGEEWYTFAQGGVYTTEQEALQAARRFAQELRRYHMNVQIIDSEGQYVA